MTKSWGGYNKIRMKKFIILSFLLTFCLYSEYYVEKNSRYLYHAYYRKVSQQDPGTIHIFIKNPLKTPISINKLYFNGIEIKDMPDDNILWYQITPEEATETEIMNLKIKQRRQTNKLIKINIELTNGDEISTIIEPKIEPLSITFIGFSKEKDKVYIYLENQGEEEIKIAKLEIDGKEKTKECFIPERTILPNSKALIIYQPEAEEELKQGKYITIKIKTDKQEAVAQTRIYSYFPIGSFGKDTRIDYYFEQEHFEIHYPKKEEEFEKIRQEKEFKVIHLFDDPGCVDGTKNQIIGTSAKEIIRRNKILYKYDKIHPTIIYGCEHQKPYNYFIYGELTDIFSVDPYEIIYYHNPPEKNAYYVKIAKKASQPRLLWTIPEAFTYRGTRHPTGQEERIIVWSEIGEGSKGIWYYVYEQKIGYPANKELEEEIKKINWELQKLKDYIVISEPFVLGKIEIEKVSPYTLVCGDKGIIVILVNNDHESKFNQQPYFTYTEKENVKIDIKIPNWLKVKSVKEIKYPEERKIDYIKEEDKITIKIEKLEITAQFLIETERK